MAEPTELNSDVSLADPNWIKKVDGAQRAFAHDFDSHFPDSDDTMIFSQARDTSVNQGNKMIGHPRA